MDGGVLMADTVSTTTAQVGDWTVTVTTATDPSGRVVWRSTQQVPNAGSPAFAVESARTTLQTLLSKQSALQTQLEADIASVTGTGWANLTAAEQQAIIGRILSDGLGSAMQAIVAHLTVDGIY